MPFILSTEDRCHQLFSLRITGSEPKLLTWWTKCFVVFLSALRSNFKVDLTFHLFGVNRISTSYVLGKDVIN